MIYICSLSLRNLCSRNYSHCSHIGVYKTVHSSHAWKTLYAHEMSVKSQNKLAVLLLMEKNRTYRKHPHESLCRYIELKLNSNVNLSILLIAKY